MNMHTQCNLVNLTQFEMQTQNQLLHLTLLRLVD